MAGEKIHDTRIIPLGGRTHLNGTVRQWLGDPRGHWEGNTLVAETTNFLAGALGRGGNDVPASIDPWSLNALSWLCSGQK